MKKNIVQFERSEHVADDWYLVANRNSLTIKIRGTVTLGEDEQGLLVLDSRREVERWVTLEVDPKGCLNVVQQAPGCRLVCPDRWIMDTAGAIVPRCTMLELPNNHVYVSQQLQRGKVEHRVVVSQLAIDEIVLPEGNPEGTAGQDVLHPGVDGLPADSPADLQVRAPAKSAKRTVRADADPNDRSGDRQPADLDAKRQAEAELKSQQAGKSQEALEEALNEVVLTRDVLEEMLSALEAQDQQATTEQRAEVTPVKPSQRAGDMPFKLVELPDNSVKPVHGPESRGQDIPLLQDVATIFVAEPEIVAEPEFVAEPESNNKQNLPGAGAGKAGNTGKTRTEDTAKPASGTQPPALQTENRSGRSEPVIASEIRTGFKPVETQDSADDLLHEDLLHETATRRSRRSISIALSAIVGVGAVVLWSMSYQPQNSAIEEVYTLPGAAALPSQPTAVVPSAQTDMAPRAPEQRPDSSQGPLASAPAIAGMAGAEMAGAAVAGAAVAGIDEADLVRRLNNAAVLLAEGYIIWPEENAVAILRGVLAQSPANLQAQQLLDSAAAQLLSQAQQAYDDGFTQGAMTVVEDVLDFHPGWQAAIDMKYAWRDADAISAN